MDRSAFPNRLQFVDLPLEVRGGVSGARISFGWDHDGASFVDDPMLAKGGPLHFARPEAAWNAVMRAKFLIWERGWSTEAQRVKP